MNTFKVEIALVAIGFLLKIHHVHVFILSEARESNYNVARVTQLLRLRCAHKAQLIVGVIDVFSDNIIPSIYNKAIVSLTSSLPTEDNDAEIHNRHNWHDSFVPLLFFA